MVASSLPGYASGQEPFEQQLGPAQAQVAWDMSLRALDLIDERIAGVWHCVRPGQRLSVCGGLSRTRRASCRPICSRMRERYGFEAAIATVPMCVQLHRQPALLAPAPTRPSSGHLHPLKYGLGLARAAQSLGVRIFERSPVTGLSRGATSVADHGAGPCARGVWRVGRQLHPGGVRACGCTRNCAAHHAGGHLHRGHCATGSGPVPAPDCTQRSRVRQQFCARLLPLQRRQPHAVWWAGELLDSHPGGLEKHHGTGAWGRSLPHCKATAD